MPDIGAEKNRFTYWEDDNIKLLEPECIHCLYKDDEDPMSCQKYKFHKPSNIMLCEKKCCYYEKK